MSNVWAKGYMLTIVYVVVVVVVGQTVGSISSETLAYVMYFDQVVIGRRDFLSYTLYFFPCSLLSSYLLHLSLCLISFLLIIIMRVFEKSLVHELLISYCYTEWCLLFSLFGARENKHIQRTLL